MLPNEIDTPAWEEDAGETIGLDWDNQCFRGRINGVDAMRQAAELAVSTERYEHLIFGLDYGIELSGLTGMGRELAAADIGRRVEEALLHDNRILGVEELSCEPDPDDPYTIVCAFRADTLFGALESTVRATAIGN